MTIAAHLPQDAEYDICVVGAGPAGTAVAFACERMGLSVLVLEVGGMTPEAGADRVAAEFEDAAKHDPLALTTREAFGGTSWAWGGQCIRLDGTDFAARPWVPESGWPIDQTDLEPHYAAAAAHLGFTFPEAGAEPPDGVPVLPGIDASVISCLTPTPRLGPRNRARMAASTRIHLCLRHAVVGLELEADGARVAGLRVAGPDGTVSAAPRAGAYVIAAGGLKSTHLLLCLQRHWPRHLGGEGGCLGRYYMGHVAGEVASVAFTDPRAAGGLLFRREQGLYQQRLLHPDAPTQAARGLLNTVFLLRQPPFEDARHRDGLLSLVHLAYPGEAGWNAFRSPGLRDVIRQRNRARAARGGPHRGHWRNVVAHPGRIVSGAARLGLRKAMRRAGVPVLSANPGGLYTLRYHAEQIPNPDSRVTLGGAPDRHGNPGLRVGFRYARADIDSVAAAHEELDRALRSTGVGRLEYWGAPTEVADAIEALAVDGYHQIGTARMSASPGQGVVDPEGRIHGIGNLFVASSCVFPTSGYANPTLTIVALALRTAASAARAARPAPRAATWPLWTGLVVSDTAPACRPRHAEAGDGRIAATGHSAKP